MDRARSRKLITAPHGVTLARVALLALTAFILCAGNLLHSSAQTPSQLDAEQKKEARQGHYHLETTKHIGGDWRNLPLEFSIKREDNVDFDSLTESNIEVKLNGHPVEVGP